jgi:exopolyphosphatase/guanosine-5'-triphosphate,3'-diphosphate pyrophosphatase
VGINSVKFHIGERDAAGRSAIPGLQPGGAEIILAGALIVGTLMDKPRQDRVLVSDRGPRHGMLIDRFSPETG